MLFTNYYLLYYLLIINHYYQYYDKFKLKYTKIHNNKSQYYLIQIILNQQHIPTNKYNIYIYTLTTIIYNIGLSSLIKVTDFDPEFSTIASTAKGSASNHYHKSQKIY